ncbi:hypothetical protein ACFVYR_01785 [Streptomyces sp. NPDC058284]|uniref:hypothetical protein n=1 Tax=unclassified Streptomyces TaxID=2593676 RepID=UPI003657BCA1
MQPIPVELGPIGPKAQELAVAVVLCGALCLLAGRLLPRAGRALEGRGPVRTDAGGDTEARQRLLSEPRRESAHVGRPARETVGVASDGALATGQARGEAERAEAEAELRGQVSEWASELASRIASEPLTGLPVTPFTGALPELPPVPDTGASVAPGGEPGILWSHEPDDPPAADPTGSGR